MIFPKKFFEHLTNNGVGYYAGVPDSLLKNFCAYVSDNVSSEKHIIAANEGAAVSLAIGHHLATGEIPLVYLQNSGLGNIINPLISLADKEVYSIPMILLIGWRGEPGVKDEPQHVKQGRITLSTLEALEIPYCTIGAESSNWQDEISLGVKLAGENSSPFAVVIKKNAFESYALINSTNTNFELDREGAIKEVVNQLDSEDAVVATTGKASRELFEYRVAQNQGHERDFLTVGGMGHASQIALGIAAQNSQRNVICLDGDGAALMHLGSMAISGKSNQKNFKHIVINNGAHDSVGGQPTLGFDINFTKIAEACGYEYFSSAEKKEDIASGVQRLLSSPGPGFLEIRVNKGGRKDLGRPTKSPLENKESIMKFLASK